MGVEGRMQSIQGVFSNGEKKHNNTPEAGKEKGKGGVQINVSSIGQ